MSKVDRFFCTCDSGKLIKCKDGNVIKYSDYAGVIESFENRLRQLEETERSILELTHPNIRKFMLENERLTARNKELEHRYLTAMNQDENERYLVIKGFQEKIKELEAKLSEKNKHNCEKWADDGRGCSICANLHLDNEKIKEIQSYVNWKINSLESKIKVAREALGRCANEFSELSQEDMYFGLPMSNIEYMTKWTKKELEAVRQALAELGEK